MKPQWQGGCAATIEYRCKAFPYQHLHHRAWLTTAVAACVSVCSTLPQPWTRKGKEAVQLVAVVPESGSKAKLDIYNIYVGKVGHCRECLQEI